MAPSSPAGWLTPQDGLARRMATETQLADVLSEFARTMLMDLPVPGILDQVVRSTVAILPITAAGVTLTAEYDQSALMAGSNEWARALERVQAGAGNAPLLLARRNGEAVTVPDLETEGRFPAFRAQATAVGLAAVFTFPLQYGSQSIGTLSLYRDSPGELAASDSRAAGTLAAVAAAYVINARSRCELLEASAKARERSLHDALTHLPNRVLLLEHLEHSLLRGWRSGSRTAVLFCDLDKFKDVNDAYGHRIGDELLVAIAARLTKRLRPGDTLARLSGDEFVLVLEDVSESQGLVIADRIVSACAEAFPLSCGELRTTASIGIAFDGRAEQRPMELLERADLAMYVAKCEGGGRYCMIGRGEQFAIDSPRVVPSDLRPSLHVGQFPLVCGPAVGPHGNRRGVPPRRLVSQELPSR